VICGRWVGFFWDSGFLQKTDRQDINELLLKVVLSTIKPNQTISYVKKNNILGTTDNLYFLGL